MEIFAVIGLIVAFVLFKGIKVVPQQEAWIMERFGKFDRALEPGLNLLLPFIEYVAYKHTLKEQAIDVPEQAGITKDNVTLVLDGVLYVRVIDPVAASYGVSNPLYAVVQLAQTTMRSEIGKLTMDQTFEERAILNTNIVAAINEAAVAWGVQCMRYEIKNITPPNTVLKAMEMQVAAERQKRAEVLQSEAKRQSDINVAEGARQAAVLHAEGEKQSTVLRSEANRIEQVNQAKGEAEAILSVAEATAEGIRKVAEAVSVTGGNAAVSMKIAEQYIDAFKNLAKTNNTILLPANTGDAGSMVAQALTVFDRIKQQNG